MNEELKGAKKHFEDCYFSDGTSDRIKNGVRKAAADQPQASVSYLYGGKKKRTVRRRVFYPAIAVLMLFAALAGATYFSPAVAKVAAQVPYFSHFIKQEAYKSQLYKTAFKTAQANKYEIRNIDVSIPDKKMIIALVGSVKSFNQIKDEAEKSFQQGLADNNFGKYEIKLERAAPYDGQLSAREQAEIEKYEKESRALKEKLADAIKAHHYNMAAPMQVRINSVEQYVNVNVPDTISDQRVSELKTLIKSVAADKYSPEVDIRKVNLTAQKVEKRWEKYHIMGILAEGLMENKHFRVTGYSYSFQTLPLNIIVKTNLDAADQQDQSVADEIEEQITYFIKNGEKTKDLRNDPYVLTIYSKDHKKMN